MKRGGILAFIIYLILGLGSVALWLYMFLSPTGFGDWVLVLLMLFMSYYGTLLYIPIIVTKILHMITGWKLFSIICIIGNVIVIGLLLYPFFLSSGSTTLDDIILSVAIILLPSVALISEIKGLTEA